MRNEFIPPTHINREEVYRLLNISSLPTWNLICKVCNIKKVRVGHAFYYNKAEVLKKYKEYIANKFKDKVE
jgi:hypothetical protein